MLDFHLFKLLKIYWRFTLNSKPICVQIRKPQRNIIFFGDLWKKENLVFLTFKDNLLALNSLLTFVSSLFIFFKQDVNVTVWKKRFVSSANMIWFSTFEAWCKSFTYNRNNKSLGASYRILGAVLVVKVSRCQIILDILHFAQFPILIFKFNFAISSFGNFLRNVQLKWFHFKYLSHTTESVIMAIIFWQTKQNHFELFFLS